MDVRVDGVPRDVLETAYAQFGGALINTKSTTWRGLSDTERAEAPLELLSAHPTLMKRPLIVAGGTLTLGWTDEVQAKWFET